MQNKIKNMQNKIKTHAKQNIKYYHLTCEIK